MKRKGFTLAELLGVIVILSVLVLIVMPLITNGIKNKEGNVSDVQKNLIYEAASQLIDSDKDQYPGSAGDIYCITFKQLEEAGLLEEAILSVAKEYDKSSVVQVRVSSSGKKSYEIVEGSACQDFSGDIKFIITPNNNKWSTSKKVEIVYPTEEGEYYKQYKLNDGSWVNYSGTIIVTKNSTIDARIIDKNNNVLVSKSGTVIKIDTVKPVIENVNLDRPWNDNLEQQVDITLSDADSGVAAYCLKNDSQTPSKDDECWVSFKTPPYGETKTLSTYLKQGTYYLFAKDAVGNITDANDNNSSFKIEDVVAPTCDITLSGTEGENGWYIKDKVTASITTSDDKSGVKDYDLTTSSSASYNKNTSISLTEDTKGITYYGYVRDKAGNTGTCTKTVKKDSEAPSCNLQQSGSKSNGWYIGNVTVSWASKTDSLSGIASYDITSSSSTPSSYSNSTSLTHTADTTGTYYYGHVKDAAGNTSYCTSAVIKKDTTAPTCSISASGTLGNNNWYKSSSVTLSLTRSDNASGVQSYDLTTSSSASYNNTSTKTLTSNTSGTTYYGYVKDAAGNTGSCTKTVKKDSTAPSCSLSASGTTGTNSWYTGSVTISWGSKTDSTSGIASYDITTSSSTPSTYYSYTSKTQSADTTGTTYYGHVKDAAGNTSYCSKTVKKDSTAPTCSLSLSGTVGNNSWYTSAVTISWGSKTDATSGISYYGITTSSSTPSSYNSSTSTTQSNDTNGITYYGHVKDAAGNTGKCSSYLKKDQTPPKAWGEITEDDNYVASGNNGAVVSSKVLTGTVYVNVIFVDYLQGYTSGKWGSGLANSTINRVWENGSDTLAGIIDSSDSNRVYYDNYIAYTGDRIVSYSMTDKAGNTGTVTAVFTKSSAPTCSYSNYTGCTVYYPCRGGSPGNTFIYDGPYSSAQSKTVAHGTSLWKINETGEFYYVRAASYSSDNSWYTGWPYGYIRKKCVTTDASYTCSYSTCPG